MRTMLLELRPSALIDTPLSDLLVQLATATTSRSGLPFKLFIEQIPSLPENVQINFYRITQEALNNIVKHAQASQVTMSLSDTLLAPDVKEKRSYRQAFGPGRWGWISPLRRDVQTNWDWALCTNAPRLSGQAYPWKANLDTGLK